MRATLYTRRQIIRLIDGWTSGPIALPRKAGSFTNVEIPPALRHTGHQYAVIGYGPVNGDKVRLYSLEFSHTTRPL
jgi:hypothetical protein